jgi:hypothetical protein
VAKEREAPRRAATRAERARMQLYALHELSSMVMREDLRRAALRSSALLRGDCEVCAKSSVAASLVMVCQLFAHSLAFLHNIEHTKVPGDVLTSKLPLYIMRNECSL